MTLGDFLRREREELSLTRHQVARAIDESENKLYRWEKGINKPDPIGLLKLMAFYDFSVPEVLGELHEGWAYYNRGAGVVQTVSPEQARAISRARYEEPAEAGATSRVEDEAEADLRAVETEAQRVAEETERRRREKRAGGDGRS